jgi:hypothetical protein
MEELSGKMLSLYLPTGREEFSEEKAKARMADVVGRYFLTVSRGPKNVRIYYDPLLMDFNIKARVQHISSYKKKFSRAEINGIFTLWHTPQEL